LGGTRARNMIETHVCSVQDWGFIRTKDRKKKNGDKILGGVLAKSPPWGGGKTVLWERSTKVSPD